MLEDGPFPKNSGKAIAARPSSRPNGLPRSPYQRLALPDFNGGDMNKIAAENNYGVIEALEAVRDLLDRSSLTTIFPFPRAN